LIPVPDPRSSLRGWSNVVLAAFLMLATLPGRTHGLGLITEPLLQELRLDRVLFANLNLWATLIGAAFCFPAGWLIDRFGLRRVTAVLVTLLGLVVWEMSRFSGGVLWLFGLVTLTRGLGQSALSVASISAVGKWFERRVGLAMGVYAFLLSALFAVSFGVIGQVIRAQGWRIAWSHVAWGLGAVALLVLLGLREAPRSLEGEAAADPGQEQPAVRSLALAEALRTPAFWVFGGGAALFGLVSSGLGLFNEAVLAERGYGRAAYHNFLVLSTMAALVGQLVCGWLSLRWSLRRLLGIAMLLYAAVLVAIPIARTALHLHLVAVLAGTAGGMITVLFFAVWTQAFGRAHLGRIQGAAQMLTVLASAIGPLLFAQCAAWTGSYTPALLTLTPVVIALGVASLRVTMPSRDLPRAAPPLEKTGVSTYGV
jgi:MFS family permease